MMRSARRAPSACAARHAFARFVGSRINAGAATFIAPYAVTTGATRAAYAACRVFCGAIRDATRRTISRRTRRRRYARETRAENRAPRSAASASEPLGAARRSDDAMSATLGGARTPTRRAIVSAAHATAPALTANSAGGA